MRINYNRHIYEGWTVRNFIDELEPSFDDIMNNASWKRPFTTRAEVKEWCMDNQPYYKKYIKEVVDYFCSKYNIK